MVKSFDLPLELEPYLQMFKDQKATISIRFYLIPIFPPAPCETPSLPPLGLVLQLAHHLIFNLEVHKKMKDKLS